MTRWRSTLFAILSFIFLLSCGQDYGVNYTVEEIVEEVVIEEIIEEIVEETVGESVLDQGYIYKQALDIVFIVDESGSMGSEQDLLAAYLPTMYLSLIGPDFSDLEWRVLVRSSDPTVPSYGWVSWDDPNPSFTLQALFTILGTGGWYEEGLDAAIYSAAFDTDFHRAEADLLIVFVSDEPDQSSIDHATYDSLMSTFKNEPFRTTEAAIVYSEEDASLYPDCTVEQIGTGYIEVSEQVVSFCDPESWDDILIEARDHVPQLNEKWPLSEVPYDPDTIRVFADTDEWFDWYYDAAENTVYLTDIPEYGTLISIIYVMEPTDTGN